MLHVVVRLPGCFIIGVCALFGGMLSSDAACLGCTNFSSAVSWGDVSINALTEASGIAASRRNLDVFWTHNDGSRQKIYALDASGRRLATFDLNKTVDDVEDIAVGPGPAAGSSYLYVGDIGGSKGTNTVRSEVKVLRVLEPLVDSAWADTPRSINFAGVETFTLVYPDGSYDAETLMIDPISGDLFVATKQVGAARLYRANLTELADKSTTTMEFAGSVEFSLASGGDISADGTRIALRREDAAMVWLRCTNDTVSAALTEIGQSIPVVGPPTEPNGEGLGFLPDNNGYVTISEGANPTIYFFQAECPSPPRFALRLTDRSAFVGASVQFRALTVGYPQPTYEWRFNGELLPGETNSSLTLSNLVQSQAGQYELVASNATGVATNMAMLVIRPKPDLRITEVMPSQVSSPGVATSDWWELTSFESEPVNLLGWRFNDNAGGLTDPFTINTALTIAPGESIVFVEGATPAQFTNWWGATNLPPNLQIKTYSGNGLSLGAGGDGIRLWNAQATDPSDTVASVDFGAAETGVSFIYDPATGQFGAKSQLGVLAVVKAARTTDIGSPGRIREPATAPVLQSALTGGRIQIEFNAMAGRRYSLESRDDVISGAWEATGDFFQATNDVRAAFQRDVAGERSFYRVLVE